MIAKFDEARQKQKQNVKKFFSDVQEFVKNIKRKLFKKHFIKFLMNKILSKFKTKLLRLQKQSENLLK